MASLINTMFVPARSPFRSPPLHTKPLPPVSSLEQGRCCTHTGHIDESGGHGTISPRALRVEVICEALAEAVGTSILCKDSRHRPPVEARSASDDGIVYQCCTKDICKGSHIHICRHSRARGSTFKPQRAGKGSSSWQLRQFAEATLGSGSLRKAVRLPEGEDINEWLAVNVVDFYNQINLLYGSITEFCSPQTCPEMKATDEFEYLWQDSENFKRPTKMPAPEYVEHLMSWCQSNIDNESMFPSRIGVPFPKASPALLRQMFKRLYRVYAHIYCHHYPVIIQLGLEPHLNTSFKHYVLFVDEHQLASGKDFWGPLGDLGNNDGSGVGLREEVNERAALGKVTEPATLQASTREGMGSRLLGTRRCWRPDCKLQTWHSARRRIPRTASIAYIHPRQPSGPQECLARPSPALMTKSISKDCNNHSSNDDARPLDSFRPHGRAAPTLLIDCHAVLSPQLAPLDCRLLVHQFVDQVGARPLSMVSLQLGTPTEGQDASCRRLVGGGCENQTLLNTSTAPSCLSLVKIATSDQQWVALLRAMLMCSSSARAPQGQYHQYCIPKFTVLTPRLSCMAALWMARLGINARIIDKRGSQVMTGQADGLSARTMEIFESMNIADFVRKKSSAIEVIVPWSTDESGGIVRVEQSKPVNHPFSKEVSSMLSQGTVETAFKLGFGEHGLTVERGVIPVALSISENQEPDSFPVTVTLQHLTNEEAPPFLSRAYTRDEKGEIPSDETFKQQARLDDLDALAKKVAGRTETEEIVHAKYVIGCEGAHSWTRHQIGIRMDGAATDTLFGVLDKGHTKREEVTPRTILEATKNILAPYEIDYHTADWWTVYQVGQRVGSGYQDASKRVFLAGDAVHTHSPKEGQGMNTSMGDTHNLGWKIAGVVKGLLKPSVLDTYEVERRAVAKRLINFDRKVTAAYASGDKSLAHKLMDGNLLFMMGGGILYAQSPLTAAASIPVDLSADMPDTSDIGEIGTVSERETLSSDVIAQSHLASRMRIGLRLDSHTVYQHSNLRPQETLKLIRGDGKWRVLVFAGDPTNPDQLARVNQLGEQLGRPGGLLERYAGQVNGAAGTQHSVSPFDFRVIHSGDCSSVPMAAFHKTFVPYNSREGYAYDRVYADSTHADGREGQAYTGYGIDKQKGCVAVVRPDQHTAHICEIDDVGSLEAFFHGFMVPRK
ncbi:hypothetical protein FH972_021777 [Carpinus fangiana]|uniref:FAD-binding domain-containing protein n=1 Tax=Carpinus fangiana TaxID=176857 RepID=A0A5N6KQV5_9ROSI|nr:hypothetical protein FH972_021777 [Carpinus fangiana]